MVLLLRIIQRAIRTNLQTKTKDKEERKNVESNSSDRLVFKGRANPNCSIISRTVGKTIHC